MPRIGTALPLSLPLALTLAAASPSGAQQTGTELRLPAADTLLRKTPPSAAALAAITARGRALAEYDAAAGRGSNAVLALGTLGPQVNRYIARKTEAGWEVVFGRSSASKDTFFVSYEARKRGDDGYYSAEALPAPRADTGFYARAGRAIDVALEDFRGELRPYTMAVIPADGGEWWVYFTPAQTKSGVYPVGADSRYRMSEDGRTILERRRMHKSVIEFGETEPAQGEEEGGRAEVRVSVLADVPEDTDVSHVLARSPSVPQLIVTSAFVYRIDVDGSITYVGRREDVLDH